MDAAWRCHGFLANNALLDYRIAALPYLVDRYGCTRRLFSSSRSSFALVLKSKMEGGRIRFNESKFKKLTLQSVTEAYLL